jgi:hypothetical protein
MIDKNALALIEDRSTDECVHSWRWLCVIVCPTALSERTHRSQAQVGEKTLQKISRVSVRKRRRMPVLYSPKRQSCI